MPFALCLAGLVLALLSAGSLLVLPVEAALGWCFRGMVLGLALAALGGYLRFQEHRAEVTAAIRRFATENGRPYRDALPADGLPQSISLFRRGQNRRCEDVVGVEVCGHPGILFHLRYWVPRVGSRSGHWMETLAGFFPGAVVPPIDFQLHPRDIHERLSVLFGGQDIDFPESPPGERFARVNRLCGEDVDAVRGFFGEHRLAYFADHPGLCVEARHGDLAVWCDLYRQGWAELWRSEWDRSLRSVAEWVPEELARFLEAARQVLPDRPPRLDGRPAGHGDRRADPSRTGS